MKCKSVFAFFLLGGQAFAQGANNPPTITTMSTLTITGGGGFATTILDSSTDNTNGLLVTGKSMTKAQEISESLVQVQWNPSFTGNPSGTYNSAGLTVTTVSNKNDQVYPWGIIAVVDNFTDVNTAGNPNAVAINGTTFTETVAASQASNSWGGNFVCNEQAAATSANPTHFCVGAEIDVQDPIGNGADGNFKRVGIYVTAGPVSVDLTSHAYAGIDIATNGTLDNGITFFPQATTGNISNLINVGLGTSHYTNLIVASNYFVDNTGSTTGVNFNVLGNINFTHMLGGATAPTIVSGFCTSPSVQNTNSTFAFQVKVGTSCAGSVGVIGLPSAADGWYCTAQDISMPTTSVVAQTTYSQTSATMTNFVRTTGVAGNYGSGDVINVSCMAF